MVHEATLVNRQQIERMVDSGLPEALNVSMETVYGPYLEGMALASDVEAGLERFLADEYRFLDEVSSDTLVAEFMHLKYDYHNARVVLKRHYFGDSGGERPFSRLGTVPVDSLQEALERNVPGFPQHLADLLESVKRIVAGGGADPQRVDIVVDRLFMERRLEIATKEKSDLLVDFSRAAIDVANLRVLLRGLALGKKSDFYAEALAEGGRLPGDRLLDLSGQPMGTISERLLDSAYGRMLTEVFVRGEETARLTSLDRATDEYLLEKVRGFYRVSVGPERIIRFMMTRESEVAMLRIIFMGKLHEVSPAVIEARLPVQYIKEA